jgi:hypothetical protein
MTKFRILTLVGLLWVSNAFALSINSINPNDTVGTAQNVDGNFSLDPSPDIGDILGNNTSTTIPHVSVSGVGNGTIDYFSFTVTTPGSLGIFDIDYGRPDMDSWLKLFTGDGSVLLDSNDDSSSTTWGAGGSVHVQDSFIQFVFLNPGLYVIGVGENVDDVMTEGVQSGNDYVLHISLQNPLVEEVPDNGSTLLLLGGGLIGLLGLRRRIAKV